MAKNPSVIIIGAGASGIAAATKLLENGFRNLIVLEAENKIGGRVCSVEFGGSIVDLGGQWVHGEEGNLVYEKVKDLDLLTTSHNTFSDNTYYLSNGSIVDKYVTDRLFEIGMKIINDKEGGTVNSGAIADYFRKVKPNRHKIVIMGAGMAGLGAALKLTELGCNDFAILEGQEEVGGRIKTITVDGRPLDIGAQWLHGKDNPLYHLAIKHDLLSEEMSEEGLGMFVRNDGVVFDEFLVKRVDFEIGKILEECQTFVDRIDHPISVGDFMEQKFLEYLDACEDTNDLRQMKLDLFDWHLRFQIIDNSCHNMKRLSAKYWGSYVCLDDVAHYNLKYGYNSLVNVMANSLPKQCIHLECEVTEILYGEEYNGVKVTCSNNQIFYCDHLIITASIGVLKDFFIIDPPLPTLLQNAIDNMGFYGIGKIYLIFDEKWWGDWKGFQFIWKADTVFEEEEAWLRHVTGFEEVFNQPKVLIGWVGSDGVKQMESLTEDEVGSICINVLRKFLPNFKIPQPNNVIRTKWFSNPWVKGSYCHITPECDDPHSGIDKISEPVFVKGVPRIILAGEAVHPSHYSTTHGAFESGQQQAAILHEYIMRE